MAGYLGSRPVVVQVDGYQRTEAESRYVNVSGDDFTGHLDFTDDAKARFGSSDEMHIYTESSGSGYSYIQGDNIVIRKADQSTNYLTALAGVVRLQPNGGNVGIGSVAPTQNLHVSSADHTKVLITGGTDKYAELQFENDAQKFAMGVQNDDKFFMYNNTGSSPVFEVDTSSNIIFRKTVGIGDTTLSTYNTNYPALELGASASIQGYTGNNGIWLQSNLFMNTNGQWTSKSDDFSAMLELYDGNFYFYNTASGTGTRTLLTPMAIKQNGNVGIGTTNPIADLSIVDSSTNTGIEIQPEIATDENRITNFDRVESAYKKFRLDASEHNFYISGSPKVTIDSTGNVGMGTSAMSDYDASARDLVIDNGSGDTGITIKSASTHSGLIYFADGTSSDEKYRGFIGYDHYNENLRLGSGGVMRMQISHDGDIELKDSSVASQNHVSGSICVKNLAATSNTFEEGPRLEGSVSDGNGQRHGGLGVIRVSGTGGGVTSGCGVGIYTSSNTFAGYDQSRNNSLTYYFSAFNFAPKIDDSSNLGDGGQRWDNIYATNTTISTSDEKEKQQIASLTAKEIKAATALSKLFKNYKWNSAVTQKGDDARTHTGVIAQEISKAMSDEGLDATKYAFFTKDTWWESTNSETKEVVQHKFKEGIPEDAVEKERYGVRYPELLSFIGAATEQRLTSIESRLDKLEAG